MKDPRAGRRHRARGVFRRETPGHCEVPARLRAGRGNGAGVRAGHGGCRRGGGVRARALCEQYYHGRADWGVVARVKEAVRVPVVGNGDVTRGGGRGGARGADRLRRRDDRPRGRRQPVAVRAGESRPRRRDSAAPARHGRRIAMARRHARLLAAREGKNIVRMRKHAMWYLSGLPGAAAARGKINACVSVEDFDRVFDELLERAGPARVSGRRDAEGSRRTGGARAACDAADTLPATRGRTARHAGAGFGTPRVVSHGGAPSGGPFPDAGFRCPRLGVFGAGPLEGKPGFETGMGVGVSFKPRRISGRSRGGAGCGRDDRLLRAGLQGMRRVSGNGQQRLGPAEKTAKLWAKLNDAPILRSTSTARAAAPAASRPCSARASAPSGGARWERASPRAANARHWRGCPTVGAVLENSPSARENLKG